MENEDLNGGIEDSKVQIKGLKQRLKAMKEIKVKDSNEGIEQDWRSWIKGMEIGDGRRVEREEKGEH